MTAGKTAALGGMAVIGVAALLFMTLGAQDPPRDKARMTELGRQHKTATALYNALKEQARGGKRLEWNALPDWRGVYSRARGGITFDPDQPPGALPTAKLTPEYHARMVKRIEMAKKGIEWDPISTCAPPGHPRWLTEPFLREFIVTPDQTWLINEMVNDIRRIYTDGRDHTPEADRYPLYDGDSIGFWDGDKLVIHTNQLKAGIYQRANPDYTDEVETVEIWQKVSDTTIEVDVWVYDPPALVEPWYTRQSYARLSDPDRNLRIRYWNCGENQNNTVIQTQEGATAFKDLTFTGKDK
ncbi:MAG TPA: hypothetical protein VFV95_19900 [Vicinamibacterales bacterium]|nr:hypothetical protein [Vicinamibacterales bacterium]